MRANGAISGDAGKPICCEPKSWLDNGIFPIEYTDVQATGDPPDPCFMETIERLWRAILAEPAAREAYRRYQPLPGLEEAIYSFVDRLSPGALRRFLSAAGVDWQSPPVEPTCEHDACHEEWLSTVGEWALPPRQRLRVWTFAALGARVESQARWPVLTAPVLAASGGRLPLRRWPRPRPLPWEDDDGNAGR